LKHTRVMRNEVKTKPDETRQGRKYGYSFQKRPPKMLGNCS
jgi:hypothetical protein